MFATAPCHRCLWLGFYTIVLPKLVLLLITRVYKGLVDVANIRPCALLFGLIVVSEEKKWAIMIAIFRLPSSSLCERYIFVLSLDSWREMDGAIHHPTAYGCDGNDMEAWAKMVQDELAIIATSVHEETIVVLPKLTTFNKVPTYRWHNVQSMAQLLSSQPVIIAWGHIDCYIWKGTCTPTGTNT